MTHNEVAFRANVGIKDIIGRELILDDNIAVIELIKNAKDASSQSVKIHFTESNKTTKASELVFSDCGDGMTIDDIQDKWLNIAYSEKKGAKKKVFAGNKGVGRFSCDRLGKKLVLYTKASNGDYIKLPIDWTLFEVNSMDADISSVKLNYQILSKKEFLQEIGETKFNTGTILKVSELRSSWGEKKLNKLTAELEKFVSAPDTTFDVYLTINDGKETQIENNVFEELNFRTYYIKSSIDKPGKEITTTLYYHGEKIYEYVVLNPYKHLKNIAIDAHYLNFTAKTYFKRRTGYSTNDYGSVFLFLNGFRVFPYGNPKNDWLGLDQRKSQGRARYLGTREILGKVSIEDHENIFNQVTSREGMVQDRAFLDLTANDSKQKTTLKDGSLDYGYVPHIMRQLERIIVNGLNWHSLIDLEEPGNKKVISDKHLKEDPTRYALKPVDPAALEDLIKRTIETNNFSVKSFTINSPLIKQLNKQSEEEYNEYILSFIKNTTGKDFEDFTPKNKGDLRKIAQENMRAIKAEKELEKKAIAEKLRADEAEEKAAAEKLRADEAEEKAAAASAKTKKAEKSAKEAKKKLKDVKEENLFLKSDANKDFDQIMNLHHQIVLYCSTAESEIENLKNTLHGKTQISTDEVLEYISSIETDVTKISKVSGYATNQKYKLALDEVTRNIVGFVSDYIDDLSNDSLALRRMKVKNNLDKAIVYKTKFSPLDVMILVDNLISNSRRAKGKEVIFSPPISKNGLFIVSDKSKNGLDSSIKDVSKIFEKGFTTTEGSGRGLYHVSETLAAIGLGISVVEENKISTGLALEVFKNVD